MATRLAKPDGLAVLEPGTFLSVFGDSPASAIPGIGPRTADALAELGIRTVGHLAASDPARLAGAFGNWSHLLREEAQGEDARPPRRGKSPTPGA
jgi:DNA polymerase-4